MTTQGHSANILKKLVLKSRQSDARGHALNHSGSCFWVGTIDNYSQ